MDIGRIDLSQMDIPTSGLPTACKPYPISAKMSNVCGKINKVIGKCMLHIKKFKPMGSVSNYSTQKPDPLNSQKTTAPISPRLPVMQ